MNINEVVHRKDWKELIKTFLPVTVSVSFPFVECMHVAGNLIVASTKLDSKESSTVDFMRDYAVNLMTVLREKYPIEWQEDWKNEAYLGILCGLVYREEESFNHLKKAYERLEHPPQSLILAYMRAGAAPSYLLSAKEIATLAEQAIKKGITYEAALQMADLAHEDTDKKYWAQKAKEAEENNVHTPWITPNVLKALFPSSEDHPREE